MRSNRARNPFQFTKQVARWRVGNGRDCTSKLFFFGVFDRSVASVRGGNFCRRLGCSHSNGLVAPRRDRPWMDVGPDFDSGGSRAEMSEILLSRNH